MAAVATQIRIDADIKKEAAALFKDLGLDLSGAVNIFLRQCLLHNGLPFEVKKSQYNRQTMEAMAEALRIENDDNVPGYTDMESLKRALEA